MVELIAQKSFRYAGRPVRHGDKFQSTEKDARVLADVLGKARRAVPLANRAPGSLLLAPRAEYQRRDLRAAPNPGVVALDRAPVSAPVPAASVAHGHALTSAPTPVATPTPTPTPAPAAREIPLPGAVPSRLEDMTRKQLYDLAIAERIEVVAADSKVAMIEKIARARAKG